MIWEWHFVPKVPLSNNGFSYHTHWLSIYCLALTLSTAFTTKFKPVQKSSLKKSSLSGPTLILTLSNFASEFILLPTSQATSLLFLPTCCFLNKNCLLRLLISILSSSVHIILPFPVVLTPISANIFMNSQPKAPAPIKNELDSLAFATKSSPKRML